MKITGMRDLFNFPGWCLDRVELSPDSSHVWLVRDGRAKLYCPNCGMIMSKNREVPRTALDLPMGISTIVTLHYNAIQGRCRACDSYATIHPENISSHEQATWRFRCFVSHLASLMPLTSVGRLLGIHGTTAMRYDRTVLRETLPPPCLDGVRVLLIDEKAVMRGHNYVTAVINGETGEPLYLADGKKGESLRGFFSKLTDEQKSSIKSVGIDRGGAYRKVITEEIPDAAIVYDKFHLIANLNQAIDEVRRDEWRKAEVEEKSFIKGQRYNLFRPWDRATLEQRWSLKALLDRNDNLNAAYVLREAFGCVWDYVYPKAAENYLRNWVSWAEETGLPALQTFARGVWRVRDGIIAYCKHHVTSGKIEAFNNQIARLLHRGCGYRNLDHLFLRLRQQYASAKLQ